MYCVSPHVPRVNIGTRNIHINHFHSYKAYNILIYQIKKISASFQGGATAPRHPPHIRPCRLYLNSVNIVYIQVSGHILLMLVGISVGYCYSITSNTNSKLQIPKLNLFPKGYTGLMGYLGWISTALTERQS